MITVIIPTVWACNEYMYKSLSILCGCEAVSEIIVINNRLPNTPDEFPANRVEPNKISIINPKNGLLFNASVNLGVRESSNDICCILNDDCFIEDNCFYYIQKHKDCLSNRTLWISPNSIQYSERKKRKTYPNTSIKPHTNCRPHGPGQMFFINKNLFDPIPSDLLHYFGDHFIYFNNIQKGIGNDLISGFILNVAGRAGAQSRHFTRGAIAADRKTHRLKYREKWNKLQPGYWPTPEKNLNDEPQT